MTLWIIVSAAVLVLLAAAWFYDRHHRAGSADVTGNALRLRNQSQGETQQYVPPRTLPPPG